MTDFLFSASPRARQMARATRGATIVDYGVLVGLLAVLSIGAIVGIGVATNGTFQFSNDRLEEANVGAPGEDGGPTLTSADCLDPGRVGTVGQSGMTACLGQLIVDDATLAAAGSTVAGGDGSYDIDADGTTYTFANGANTIYTGQVTNLDDMFAGTGGSPATYNGDISHWDTSAVTSMSGTFANNTAFNQDLSGWDVSSVQTMDRLFFNATAFDQDLSGWTTSSVTTMEAMFGNADAFTGSIVAWDTALVQTFDRMFQSNDGFNQNISGWETGSATSMTEMFNDATSFNQDLSGWCVSAIGSAPSDFDTGASAWTGAPGTRPNWGASC